VKWEGGAASNEGKSELWERKVIKLSEQNAEQKHLLES